MSLEELVDSTYGPFPVCISAEQVAAYVAVTGDDASRWVDHAPPAYAGALLFAVAPTFLNAEEVKPYTKLLVQADQTFTWNRALQVDEHVTVDGVVERVRVRADTNLVTFRSAVWSGSDAVIEASSTFLMGEGAPAVVPDDEIEPPVEARGAYEEIPGGVVLEPGPVPEMARSASRLDLVRYAAASGDFNPVHFDQATARRAGFPGVLVHGLFMGAWLLQLGAAYSSRPDPFASVRLRFRNPLRPVTDVTVGGAVEEVTDGGAKLALTLRSISTEYVAARIQLRTP